jgi:selenide,water dikinase
VWKLDDGTCIIATTDFFMPMVDDPFDFGRIAATNAISDVYAMGGTPIMALAILGMPIEKMPTAMVRDILRGGAAVCASAGIPVAGGHSIDTPEPIYGLAVIGLCHPDQLRRCARRRRVDPHQGARRRHLFLRDQEGPAAARRL